MHTSFEQIKEQSLSASLGYRKLGTYRTKEIINEIFHSFNMVLKQAVISIQNISDVVQRSALKWQVTPELNSR